MRIKNFIRFINENLEPEPVEDKTIIGDVRKGEPEDEPDYGDFDYEDWQPTGYKPRKQKPDTELNPDEEFDYDDYYPYEEDEEEIDEDDFDFEEDLDDVKGTDQEPFISDVDVDTDTSEIDDYFY